MAEIQSEYLDYLPHDRRGPRHTGRERSTNPGVDTTRKVINDIPNQLVNDYFHWLDIESQEVELRPIDQPWVSSSENWVLKMFNGPTLQKECTSESLLDMQGPTLALLEEIFAFFDCRNNLFVTVNNLKEFTLELPRFALVFTLNAKGQLECRNFPGMVIDPSQEIGTLIGLKSLLVLRSGEVTK